MPNYYAISPSLFDKGLDINLETNVLSNKDYDTTTLLEQAVQEETNNSILSIVDREKIEYKNISTNVSALTNTKKAQRIRLFLEDRRNGYDFNLPALSPTFEFFNYTTTRQFASLQFRNSFLQMTLYDRPTLDANVLSNVVIPAFKFQNSTGIQKTTSYFSIFGDSIQNLQIPKYISDNEDFVFMKFTFHDSRTNRIIKLRPFDENIYPTLTGDVRQNTLSFNTYKANDEFIPIELNKNSFTFELPNIDLMQVIIDQQVPSFPPPPPPTDDDDQEDEEPPVLITATTGSIFSVQLLSTGTIPSTISYSDGNAISAVNGVLNVNLGGYNTNFTTLDSAIMVPLQLRLARALNIDSEITIIPSFGVPALNGRVPPSNNYSLNYFFLYKGSTISDQLSALIEIDGSTERLTFTGRTNAIVDENDTVIVPSFFDGVPPDFAITVPIPSGTTRINLNYFAIANLNPEIIESFSDGCGQDNRGFTRTDKTAVNGTLTILGNENIQLSNNNTVQVNVLSEGYSFDDCSG